MIEFTPSTQFEFWKIASLLSSSLNLIGIGLIAIAVAIVIQAIILKSKNKTK